MRLQRAFLEKLITEINQYFNLELNLEDNLSCAFIDQHGIYFQLSAVDSGMVIISADLGRVVPYQKEVLLEALLWNGNLSLDGAFVGLGLDKSTLLLIRELTEACLSGKKAKQWLSPFVIMARSLSDKLESIKEKSQIEVKKP